VYLKKKLAFAVTSKERLSGIYINKVWPQIMIVGLTILSFGIGAFRYFTNLSIPLGGLLINIFWGGYNILLISVIIWAAFYKPRRIGTLFLQSK
jgi:cellulose synthase (UDP-forming)